MTAQFGDPNNFVAPSGNGFDVYVGGVFKGNYPSQQQAQQQYNALGGPGSNAPSTGPGFTVGGGSAFLPPAVDLASQLAQQQYLRDRLGQIEIPTLQLQQMQNAWQQMLARANLTGYMSNGGGNGAPMDANVALDAIWQKRPDLATFYKNNGWDVSTVDAQRKAVQDWLRISPEGTANGGDPIRTAQALGVDMGGQAAGGWTKEQALDYIWNNSPAKQWYQSQGKDVTDANMTPQMRREAANHWLVNVGDRQSQSVAGDPLAYAQSLGAQVQTPTFERQKWEAAKEQYFAGLKAQLTGPRDWIKYQQVQPTGAFGTMQPTPSWESAGVGATSNQDWWNRTQGTPAGTQQGNPMAGTQVEPGTNPTGRETSPFGPVRQPTSIKPTDYANMSDTARQMQEGLWLAQGIRPEDAWQQMRAAQPKGSASAITRWA